MSCAHPWKCKNPNPHTALYQPYITLPCGRCLNCISERQKLLADCFEYEYRQKGCGSFITLTYDDYYHVKNAPHITPDGIASLNKRDAQKWLMRLRSFIIDKKLDSEYCSKDFKYMLCGEYGDQTQRNHFHCVITGISYRLIDGLLEHTWKYGLTDSGEVKAGGVRYITKYMEKQVKGSSARMLYDDNGLERPFLLKSKGLGYGLFFEQEEFIRKTHCYKNIAGKVRPLPSYISNILHVKNNDSLDSTLDKMLSYGITPKKVGNAYDVAQLDSFKSSIALQLEEHKKFELLSHGTPVDDKMFDPRYYGEYTDYKSIVDTILDEPPF